MAEEKDTENVQATAEEVKTDNTATKEDSSKDEKEKGFFRRLWEKIFKKKEEKVYYNPKDQKDYDIDSYINVRWNDQYEYFEDKANKSRDKFNKTQKRIIILSALSVFVLSFNLDTVFKDCTIPILNVKYNPEVISITNLICAAMSFWIMILTSFDKLFQYSSEWTKKRNAQERLKTEIFKFKNGVEPYAFAAPEIVPDAKPEKTEPEKKNDATTSKRAETLLAELSKILVDFNDSAFRDVYKSIKNEIAHFVSAVDNYESMSSDKITDKDKLFINRVSDEIEKSLAESTNIFRAVKDEIADYYADCGAYLPAPAKPKEKKDSRDEILAKNRRLFVARIEAIVAQDVEDFVSAKTQNSEPKKADEKEDDKK